MTARQCQVSTSESRMQLAYILALEINSDLVPELGLESMWALGDY